jgi:voltage-gated potassium channel Kch
MRNLFFAFGLMALSVTIHAVGLALAFRWLERAPDRPRALRRWIALLIAVAGWTIFVHLIEVTVWALFFVWTRSLPDVPTALYFSAVTYTTTGYGDVVLPTEWRLLGAIEALTGILMCGWSTGFFFSVVGRIHVSTKEARKGGRS